MYRDIGHIRLAALFVHPLNRYGQLVSQQIPLSFQVLLLCPGWTHRYHLPSPTPNISVPPLLSAPEPYQIRMSTGPSTSAHSHSYSVDPPRGGAVSSTQLPLMFGPVLEASPRNSNPPPPFPLACPTGSSQITSGHSATDAILSTTFQPQVPSQAFYQVPSDEPRNRLFDEYVLAPPRIFLEN